MLRLSIITTLYQSAGYMEKCLATLLDQDLSENEYEIILVNDGSPDESLLIAERYAAEHINVRVISYEINRGLAGARQAGTDAANGEYLCYVDPDDWIEIQSFGPVVKRMEEDRLDMLRFNYRMVDQDGNILQKPSDARIIDYSSEILNGPEFLRKRLGYGCFVWAYIYRTSLIKDSGVRFRQGDYFDDTAWLPQIIRKAKRIDSFDVIRYNYFQRSDSLVNAVSKDSVVKKLDASLVVISRLKDQMETADQVSMQWYRGMCSKLALSILSSSAVQVSNEYNQYLHKIKKYGVFPLHSESASKSQKAKLLLLNISPKIFQWMISRKDNKKNIYYR